MSFHRRIDREEGALSPPPFLLVYGIYLRQILSGSCALGSVEVQGVGLILKYPDGLGSFVLRRLHLDRVHLHRLEI